MFPSVTSPLRVKEEAEDPAPPPPGPSPLRAPPATHAFSSVQRDPDQRSRGQGRSRWKKASIFSVLDDMENEEKGLQLSLCCLYMLLCSIILIFRKYSRIPLLRPFASLGQTNNPFSFLNSVIFPPLLRPSLN